MVGPPPVASSTAWALTKRNAPLRTSTKRTPASAPSFVGISATARCSSRRRTGRAQTCSISRLISSMPVRSPLCTVRSKLCPAKALPCSVPSGLRSKKQPTSFSSSRTRSTALITRVQASSWCASHLPPSMVSMKCRSTESPGWSATLYPPWTMRVQPHLPSRPLVATVMSRSGSAACACSAANSPAPPDPRIRISVCIRSSAMRSMLQRSHQEHEGDEGGNPRRNGCELLLAVAPGEIFDDQEAQAAQQMHREQEDEAGFGELHEPRVGPAQQRLQPCFGVDGEAERPEMQRQEYRKRQSGKPMHQRREPEQVATMVEPRTLHGSTTAATARKPIASSSRPTPVATASTLRPLSGDHSINIVRRPIGA